MMRFSANAIQFSGENYAEICLMDPGKFHAVEKRWGPGNVYCWLEHADIPERILIGHWVLKLGDGTILSLPDRTLRLLDIWTARHPNLGASFLPASL